MKKAILCLLAASMALTALAQGHNTGNGGYDGDYASLAQRLLNLEKKNDNFNLFLNFSSSYQLSNVKEDWASAFMGKQLRLEIKGQFGDRLTYRIRHRLNRSQAQGNFDNLSKATDCMFVGWKLSDKFTLMGGKMCQFWGGFEFDENPMYIYEYSDMINNLDNFLSGVALAYYPFEGHEFVVNISNSYSNTLETEYPGLTMADGSKLVEAWHPLAYIFNWNGSFWNGRINTRWAVGAYQQAYNTWDKMVFLGTQLNLPSFQVYFDWMSAWEGVDRLRLASQELCRAGGAWNGRYLPDVHYNSFVLKANWQFTKGWNLMAKGMYETATAAGMDKYRLAAGYIGALEYYPVQDQDFRVFLSYVGRHRNYTRESGLGDLFGGNTNRIEIGLMYRIKAY